MRLIFAAILSLLSLEAYSATVSRVTDFSAGTRIQADDLNDEFDNIISALNGNLNTANILDGGISTADIASYAISKVKLAALGQQKSVGSNVVSSVGVGDSEVLSVALTTVGRPVFIGLIPDETSSNASFIGAIDSTSLRPKAQFTIRRNASTDIAYFHVGSGQFSGTGQVFVPPGSVFTIDAPTASTHTYKLRIKGLEANSTATMNAVKMIVYEL